MSIEYWQGVRWALLCNKLNICLLFVVVVRVWPLISRINDTMNLIESFIAEFSILLTPLTVSFFFVLPLLSKPFSLFESWKRAHQKSDVGDVWQREKLVEHV